MELTPREVLKVCGKVVFQKGKHDTPGKSAGSIERSEA